MTQPSYRTIQGLRLSRVAEIPQVRAWLRHHLAQLVLATSFILLSLAYNVTIPLWESDNEWSHYRYVRFLVTQNRLPPAQPPEYKYDSRGRPLELNWPQMEYWQFSQPPLYYLLLTPLLRLVDIRDDLHPDRNLFGVLGNIEDGVNVAVHGPEEAFPYHGTALAVHLLRLGSLAFGLLTVAAAWAMGRLLWPDRSHFVFVCAAVVAFVPTFVISSNVINNDILAIALCSWTAVFALRVFLYPGRIRTLLALVVCFILAVLAKYTAFAMLPLVLGVVLFDAGRRLQHNRLGIWLSGITLAVLFAVLIALMRSNMLATRFGGLVGAALGDLVDLARLQPNLGWIDWTRGLQLLHFAYDTFWLILSQGRDVPLRTPYLLIEGVSIVALVGLVIRLIQRQVWPRRASALLILACLVGVMVPFYRTMRLNVGGVIYGRYLMVLIVPLVALLVTGLGAWWPSHPDRPGKALAALCLGLSLWLVPYMASFYAPPEIIRNVDPAHPERILRADEYPLLAVFGDNAQLVGYSLWPTRLRPEQGLGVTLVWRALRPFDRNYTVSVNVLQPDGTVLGQHLIYPAGGRYATRLWQPGDVFRDTVWVPLQIPAEMPVVVHAEVALLTDDDRAIYLPVRSSQGEPIGDSVRFGEIPLSSGNLSPNKDVLAQLGDSIRLTGEYIQGPADGRIQAGQPMTVTLYWQTERQIAHNYTVFIHLLDSSGQQIDGFDANPAAGYGTLFWLPGEQVTDHHPITLKGDLPPGSYSLWAGMYDKTTGERLPVIYQGKPLPDGSLPLTTLTVVR